MPPRTLLEVVQLSAGYLKERGSDSPRLDAELLMAHVLGLRRLDLYLQFDRPLLDPEVEAMRELVRRRSQHEPVAYILGEREFYGRSFAVNRAVLIPRPETELLIDKTLAFAREIKTPLRIADLGAGSGCIAVTLAAELPSAEVVAVEISGDAAALTCENATRHGVGDRVRVLEQSWSSPLPGPFDIVVSNPPYISRSELGALAPDVRDWEPESALVHGDDGTDAYAEILAIVNTLLNRPGWLALEIDPRRRAAVERLLRAALPDADVEVGRDLRGDERLISAHIR